MWQEIKKTPEGRKMMSLYDMKQWTTKLKETKISINTTFKVRRQKTLMACGLPYDQAAKAVEKWFEFRNFVDPDLFPNVVNKLRQLSKQGYKLVACSNGITDLSKSVLHSIFDLHLNPKVTGVKKA
eukprot:UN26400